VGDCQRRPGLFQRDLRGNTAGPEYGHFPRLDAHRVTVVRPLQIADTDLRGVADEDDPERIAYVYPRRDTVVLGGQRAFGVASTDVDEELTARVRRDCAALDPRIASAAVREVRVGLRPGRSEVRLEPEVLSDGRTVIHDYGHSGAGYILSWGCAEEVEGLAAAARR
jgi:hypothetical protein